MTHVERNYIETYLKNINNLIALKLALEESLIYTTNELDYAMYQLPRNEFEEVLPDEKINAPSEYYTETHLNQYSDTLKKVMEEILPCWKLTEK